MSVTKNSTLSTKDPLEEENPGKVRDEVGLERGRLTTINNRTTKGTTHTSGVLREL